MSCYYPTKRVLCLLTLLPHNQKLLCENSRCSGLHRCRALFCPPPLHFTSESEASGQVGSILALWFKALGQLCCSLSWISLAYLQLHFTIGFFTFRVLHLNFNEVSAILGTSVITACITRAARQRGIVQMCQAANCLKQLL